MERKKKVTFQTLFMTSLNQKVQEWCKHRDCSDWTFFHIFNIPKSLYFYLNSPPQFPSKCYQNFAMSVEKALNMQVRGEIKERLQEFSQSLICKHKNIFQFKIHISYNDNEMYIYCYDKQYHYLDLFFQHATSKFSLENIVAFKLGQRVLIEGVEVQLQLRELW